MLARLHFLANRHRKGPVPPVPGPPAAPHARTSERGRCFVLACETEAGFARGNYGTHPFTRVEVGLWASHLPPPDSLPPQGGVVWDGRLLARGRGRVPPGGVCDPVVLITTCQIGEADAPRFLDQFRTARDHLLGCPGFLRHHLFEAAHPGAIFRFVNVAAWRGMDDFVAAFSSPDFKALIKGGFDHTSQIIVARAATDAGSIPP